MQGSSESIRRRFLLRQGEAAFESVARLFAEVCGDSTRLDLSRIDAWREFAASFTEIPLSTDLSKAFLWCIRHNSRLDEIRRPTIPPALNSIEDPEVIRELFSHCPYFLASSETGFRCAACFDIASQLTEMYVNGDRQIRSFQMAAQSLSPPHHMNRRSKAAEKSTD